MSESLIRTHGVAIAVLPQQQAGALNGDWVHMQYHSRCSIIIALGNVANSSVVSLEQATDNAGTGAKALTIERAYISGANNDTFAAHAISGGNVTIGAGEDNSNLIIEIHENDLDVNNDFNYLRVNLAAGTNNLVSATYIMMNPRYIGDVDEQLSVLS